jgi:hypothetical protein
VKLDVLGLISNVYSAHRASNPAKYPLSVEVKKLYPAYEGVEGRMKSTTVHLQVYDGTHTCRYHFLVFSCLNVV